MNKGIVTLISILAALIVVSGCSNMAPQSSADRPILSAAQAQAQIKVSVRTLAPITDTDSILAAND